MRGRILVIVSIYVYDDTWNVWQIWGCFMNICVAPWKRTGKKPTGDSIYREKNEQILLAYGLPKETAAAITILYRNT